MFLDFYVHMKHESATQDNMTDTSACGRIIFHIAVSRLRRSHFITFSGNICFQFTRESWQKTETLITPSSTSFAFAKAGSFKRTIYSNVRLDWQIFIDIFKFSFHYSSKGVASEQWAAEWVNNQINQIKERLNKIFKVTYSPSRPRSLPLGRGSRVTSRGSKNASKLFLNALRQIKTSSYLFLFTRVSGSCFHPILVIFRCLYFWPGHRFHVVVTQITLQSSK